MRNKPVLLLLFVLLVTLAVGYWPSDELSITQSCEPKGALASFKALLQGDRFWNSQLRHLDKEVAWTRQRLERRAKAQRYNERPERKSNKAMEELYAKYPNLRPSAAETAAKEEAEALRERADAIEQTALAEKEKRVFMKWLAELEECRPVLVSRSR